MPVGSSINSSLSELKQWHKVTVDFSANKVFSEANAGTFRDYRLEVTFTHADGTKLTVPGYFAADGDAIDSGATSGTIWRAHFNPPKTGAWTYKASFVTGDDVAVGKNLGSAKGVEFNGSTGKFSIGLSNKEGDDFRGKGVLVHENGDRYLTFKGTGEAFLKGGAGSPENFLAYKEFDGTKDLGGIYKNFLHAYAAHRQHAKPADPTWSGQNGTGDEILGALNYLAGKGINALYFLTLTLEGDGDDVWPWTSPTDRSTFDVSKLDQWGAVFDHAQKLGIYLDLYTQEQENDQLLNGGALGAERMLYYRELVARFGHVNGLTWNLGEENTNSLAQRKAFADFFRDLDPYDHPISVHTFPNMKDQVYNGLLGFKPFDGPSLQSGDGHGETLKWIQKSAASGHPWVVSFDEFGGAGVGNQPDSVDPTHDKVRSEYLWGNLMAGGAGVNYYVGYSNLQDDLTLENFAILKNLWEQTDHALYFFNKFLPVQQMKSMDNLLPQNGGKSPAAVEDYVLAKTGQIYAVYIESGGTTKLNLNGTTAKFEVDWYDPRNGGNLQHGSVTTVTGGGTVDLGSAPGSLAKDWVVLLRKTAGGTPDPDPGSDPITLLSDPDLAGKVGSVNWGKGVTLNVLSLDDQPAPLTHGAHGFGIAGSRQYFQLDHDPAAKKSEAFIIDFNRAVVDVEVTLGRFFSKEAGGIGETGKWIARGASGQVVAEGGIDKDHGTQLDSGYFEFEVGTSKAFHSLELNATSYEGNSSDFTLRSVTFTATQDLLLV
jgi:hypothetical protein